jgi:hypothetical protein
VAETQRRIWKIRILNITKEHTAREAETQRRSMRRIWKTQILDITKEYTAREAET